MRLFMGVIVTGMGFVMLEHTPWALFQIVCGSFLIWRGVREEIAKTRKSQGGHEG